MSTIENLQRAYERHLRVPWDPLLAGPQKVWFVIYDPHQERRLRARLGAFQAATEAAGHGWRYLDLTDAFAAWLGAHEYRESYFKHPDDLDEAALREFNAELAARIVAALTAADVDERTIVAVGGIGALYPMMRVSRLIKQIDHAIIGRLVIFFPGEREGNTYKLLNARDGWDYMAVPIEASNGD